MNKEDEYKYVLNTTVRFFRNVEDVPFAGKFSGDDAEDINTHAKAACEDIWGDNVCEYNINNVDKAELASWYDRNFCQVSSDPTSYGRYIFTDPAEEAFVLTNEAEHIFVQAKEDSFLPERAFNKATELVNSLSSRIPFVVSSENGFLTANPYVSGAAMKVSFLLHLPALSIGPRLGKLSDELAANGISVKSFYSENRKAFGAFWQINNLWTRGVTESEILEITKKSALQLIEAEEEARSEFIGKNRIFLEDLAWRSLGLLSSARKLEMREFMSNFSNVRLAASLGMFDIAPDMLGEIMLHAMDGYLINYTRLNGIPETENSAVVRARIIREELSPIFRKALL